MVGVLKTGGTGVVWETETVETGALGMIGVLETGAETVETGVQGTVGTVVASKQSVASSCWSEFSW